MGEAITQVPTNMQKVLLIHHLEPTWSDAYIRIGNTTFATLCEKTAKHIEENNYDKVILTQFEYMNLDDSWPYEPLLGLIDEQHEYGYGWHRSMFECDCHDEEDFCECDRYKAEYCEGGYHSEVVLIEEWQKKLKNHDVYLCGAFEGECLEDIEIALKYCNVSYQKVRELII